MTLDDAASTIHEGVGLTTGEVEETDGLRSAVVAGLTIGEFLNRARHAVVGDVARWDVAHGIGRHRQGYFAVAVLNVLRSASERSLREVEDVVDTVAIVVSAGVLYGLAIVNVTRVGELRSDGVEDHDVLRGVCGVRVSAVVSHNGLPRTRHNDSCLQSRSRRLHSHHRWSQCSAAAGFRHPVGSTG